MPNCPSCGRFMSRGNMEKETELSSKVFECNNCGEKVVTDPDGYWVEIDKERDSYKTSVSKHSIRASKHAKEKGIEAEG